MVLGSLTRQHLLDMRETWRYEKGGGLKIDGHDILKEGEGEGQKNKTKQKNLRKNKVNHRGVK